MSPLGFEWLNFLGRYNFSLPEAVREGDFRPLRTPGPQCQSVHRGSFATWRRLREPHRRIAQAQVARRAIAHGLACPHEDIFECSNFASVVAARLTRSSNYFAPH